MTDSMVSYVDFNYYPSDQLNPYPMNRHPFHLNLTQPTTVQTNNAIAYDKFYYFIHLPKPLQLKILSFLNLRTRLNSSYSCKLIRNLLKSGELWETLDLSNCFNSLNKFQLVFLSKLGGVRLKRANFRGCQQIDGNILWTLGSNSPNLTSINLSGCSELTSQNLSSFFYFTKNLTQLNLSGLSCLTPITLTSIGDNCPKLIELNLNWCKLIGNNEGYLRKLIGCLSGLTKLKINGWKYLSYGTLSTIGGLRELRYLDMQNCQGLTNFRSNGNSLDNQLNFTTLEGILRGEPIKKLIYLNLNNSNLATDSTFIEFSKQLPELEWLDLSNCPQLKQSSLNSIILNCPRLTHLSLEDTPIAHDLNLRLMCLNLTELEWLNLGFNLKLTNEGIGRLVRNLRNLKYFSIEGCDQVTDDLILELGNWLAPCSKFECLNVKECKLISADKVMQFQRGLILSNSKRRGRGFHCSRVKLLSSFDFLDSHGSGGNGNGIEGSGFGELVGLTSCIIL